MIPRASSPWRAVAVSIALGVVACGAGPRPPQPTFVAVLAAFPAELAALVRRARIEEEVALGDRTLRLGWLGNTRVVLGMTGFGLVNARRTTRAVLDRFEIRGVVVSGVAGSPARIGDVVVPEAWTTATGARFEAAEPWLEVVREIASTGLALDRCTELPATGEPVCLPHGPAVLVGGVGRSDDSFGDLPFPCDPGGDDVFGCDITEDGAGRPGSAPASRAGAVDTVI